MGQKVRLGARHRIDDGTIANPPRLAQRHDEGTPTGRTVLIEKGILTGYMQDRLNARPHGRQAHGQRAARVVRPPPMPRMTNTFIARGRGHSRRHHRSVTRGLYAVTFGGGAGGHHERQVVFSASEAYLIEDGPSRRRSRARTLIGNGRGAQAGVSRVGRDLQLDEGWARAARRANRAGGRRDADDADRRHDGLEELPV